MTTFFCTPCIDFSGTAGIFTIATGPVVVNRAGTKILLHIGQSTGKWQFIGGRYVDTMTFRENALQHGHAVVWDTTITLIDESHPVVVFDTIDLKGYEEKTLLIHYKATIDDEEKIGDAKWYTLDEILLLDAMNQTSSSNVRIVSEQLLQH